MAKLYKIEFQDYGWTQLLGFLDSYIDYLQKDIERFKKEKEKAKDEFWREQYEGLISAYERISGMAKGYMRQIKTDLEEQGLEIPEYVLERMEHVK